MKNTRTVIFEIQIPIPSYDGEGIFHQSLYFNGIQGPTRERVLEVLTQLHKRDKSFPEYINDWFECIRSVRSTREWKRLDTNNDLVSICIDVYRLQNKNKKTYPYIVFNKLNVFKSI